jgi:NAD(P)-dependent dehydrogenase (short-subunit alcohol dehydrogenase family)
MRIAGSAMAKAFITGSADGLGQLAANALIAQGHQVVLHARNEKRGQDALNKAPGAADVVIADLTSIDETPKTESVDLLELGHASAGALKTGEFQN